MNNKKTEATLVGYRVLFDKKGNLMTERTSTDLKYLESVLSRRDYNILRTVIHEATIRLNDIHNQIEVALDARK
jgi:hypothetical protein